MTTTIQPPANPLTEDSTYQDVFPHLQTAEFDALYDMIIGARNDIMGGYDTDYAAGICHTLRLLGMFTQAQINAWSTVPYRIAYEEMLHEAACIVARICDREV